MSLRDLIQVAFYESQDYFMGGGGMLTQVFVTSRQRCTQNCGCVVKSNKFFYKCKFGTVAVCGTHHLYFMGFGVQVSASLLSVFSIG